MRVMASGRTTTHGQSIRNVNDLRTERPHGDVMKYTLPPDELEKYRAMTPQKDSKGKPYVFHGRS